MRYKADRFAYGWDGGHWVVGFRAHGKFLKFIVPMPDKKADGIARSPKGRRRSMGAAHLPGMTASLTTLPVIGVPVKTSTAAVVDSLFSIVQMPPGIPVATVAINGAKNAALLTIKILAVSDKKLGNRLQRYQKEHMRHQE